MTCYVIDLTKISLLRSRSTGYRYAAIFGRTYRCAISNVWETCGLNTNILIVGNFGILILKTSELVVILHIGDIVPGVVCLDASVIPHTVDTVPEVVCLDACHFSAVLLYLHSLGSRPAVPLNSCPRHVAMNSRLLAKLMLLLVQRATCRVCHTFWLPWRIRNLSKRSSWAVQYNFTSLTHLLFHIMARTTLFWSMITINVKLISLTFRFNMSECLEVRAISGRIR